MEEFVKNNERKSMNYIAEIGWNFIGDLELAEQNGKSGKRLKCHFCEISDLES